MMDEIMHMPGKIWHYLNSNGESTIYGMKKDLGLPDSLIYIGIGWLVKEDKINIKREGGSIKVSLK
ncbi:MAG: winged helix-turn-helix domain-containing protein [Candidatus Firestonebacteria bacterium]